MPKLIARRIANRNLKRQHRNAKEHTTIQKTNNLTSFNNVLIRQKLITNRASTNVRTSGMMKLNAKVKFLLDVFLAPR